MTQPPEQFETTLFYLYKWKQIQKITFRNSGIIKVTMIKKAFPWHYLLVYYGGVKS